MNIVTNLALQVCNPKDYGADGEWAGKSVREKFIVFGYQATAALRQLHADCTTGGLPQQLQQFGMACCAAFPQRGACGNPACTNLERFSEASVAKQGCTGCDKVGACWQLLGSKGCFLSFTRSKGVSVGVCAWPQHASNVAVRWCAVVWSERGATGWMVGCQPLPLPRLKAR